MKVLQSQITVVHDRDAETTAKVDDRSKQPCRPRLPALHGTQPSADLPILHAQLGGKVLNSPAIVPQLPQSRSSCGSSYVEIPLVNTTCSSDSSYNQDITDPSGAIRKEQKTASMKASKGVPKRKSLAGLFGLDFKKSFSNAANLVSPANPTPANDFAITWGGRVEADVQRNLRALAGNTNDHARPVTSPHKASPPYCSRFGDSVQHFERNMLQGYGKLSLPTEKYLLTNYRGLAKSGIGYRQALLAGLPLRFLPICHTAWLLRSPAPQAPVIRVTAQT